MLTSDFIEWLSGLDIGQPMPAIYQGPDGPPSEPRPHLVVTPLGSGGMLVDGYIEQRAFQILTVGSQGLNPSNWNQVYSAAEKLARDIDKAIVNAGRPVIGGEQVVYISRFGSAPGGGPAGQPRDAAYRPAFQATYVVEAESSLFEN